MLASHVRFGDAILLGDIGEVCGLPKGFDPRSDGGVGFSLGADVKQ
jgi:hypothetical protein